MLTVKQRMLYDVIKKLYNKIHSKKIVFTDDYCKGIVKTTITEIYKIYPDKNVGKLSINWYDKNLKQMASICDETFCFEVNFHDIYSGLPWLICRFYKGTATVGIYLKQ